MNTNYANTISRALVAVNDIATYARRGDMPMAEQARRTLNDLCASAEGYPAPVRNALFDAGLRVTPR